MSVLIKGMEMPPSCRYCEFRHLSLTQNAFCTASHETIDYMAERTKRLDNCPLVPVPPHGRLIDADALKDKPVPINGYFDYERDVFVHYPPTYMQAIDDIVNAPTIIPAEEGE